MGDERPIFERLLRHLEVTHQVSRKDLEHIPRTGPTVLVVNHPFRVLEGAVLAAILGEVRPDVKFLADGLLSELPEFRDFSMGLRRSLRFLHDGGLLVVFPAGEVSHFQWRERGVADPPWNPAVARILAIAARRTGAVVAPAHVDGANSLLFQTLGLLHPRLRTALLARELLNKRRARVGVRIGSPISAARLLEIPTDEERMQYLRWRSDLLASRNQFRTRTALPFPRRRATRVEAVAPAVPCEALAAEVAALPPEALLASSGDLAVYLSAAGAIPRTLEEIARLRETTFRAVGEGTGCARDLDRFDATYLHLFVWNEAKREAAGAYRLAGTDVVTAGAGPDGLYTATLFKYGQAFLDRIGPALELGRSFVRTEYQKSFAPLLLLWKGIGKYVSRNPRYRILFGPVSISNQYQAASRELMVAFLERHASLKDWAGLVAGRNPFRRPGRLPLPGLDLDDVSAAVSDIEPSRAGVPILLRQYLKLGGKLLGFNVDAKFSNALDGLILVNLTETEPKLLARYLGKDEATRFLEYQKGK